MIRPIFTELALFLTPFVVYAAFLVATRAGILHPPAWSIERLANICLSTRQFLELPSWSVSMTCTRFLVRRQIGLQRCEPTSALIRARRPLING